VVDPNDGGVPDGAEDVFVNHSEDPFFSPHYS
jgi:hypothetical protein